MILTHTPNQEVTVTPLKVYLFIYYIIKLYAIHH